MCCLGYGRTGPGDCNRKEKEAETAQHGRSHVWTVTGVDKCRGHHAGKGSQRTGMGSQRTGMGNNGEHQMVRSLPRAPWGWPRRLLDFLQDR